MITDEVKVGRVGLRGGQVRYDGFQRTEHEFSALSMSSAKRGPSDLVFQESWDGV